MLIEAGILPISIHECTCVCVRDIRESKRLFNCTVDCTSESPLHTCPGRELFSCIKIVQNTKRPMYAFGDTHVYTRMVR